MYALRTNRVRYQQHTTHIDSTRISFKTLTTLDLSNSSLWTEDTKHLGDALRINRVRERVPPLSYSSHSNPSQTLTTLDLFANTIAAEGAKQLGDALRINKVSQRRLPLSSILYIQISHRHSPHSSSLTILYEMREQNILLMH